MTRLHQDNQLCINEIHQYRSPQNQLFRARRISEQAYQSNVNTLIYFTLRYFFTERQEIFRQFKPNFILIIHLNLLEYIQTFLNTISYIKNLFKV